MLGDIRLAQAQMSFQVADALFAIPEEVQNSQPGWVDQYLEKICLFKIHFMGSFGNHIQYSEYDYNTKSSRKLTTKLI